MAELNSVLETLEGGGPLAWMGKEAVWQQVRAFTGSLPNAKPDDAGQLYEGTYIVVTWSDPSGELPDNEQYYSVGGSKDNVHASSSGAWLEIPDDAKEDWKLGGQSSWGHFKTEMVNAAEGHEGVKDRILEADEKHDFGLLKGIKTRAGLKEVTFGGRDGSKPRVVNLLVPEVFLGIDAGGGSAAGGQQAAPAPSADIEELAAAVVLLALVENSPIEAAKLFSPAAGKMDDAKVPQAAKGAVLAKVRDQAFVSSIEGVSLKDGKYHFG